MREVAIISRRDVVNSKLIAGDTSFAVEARSVNGKKRNVQIDEMCTKRAAKFAINGKYQV